MVRRSSGRVGGETVGNILHGLKTLKFLFKGETDEKDNAKS